MLEVLANARRTDPNIDDVAQMAAIAAVGAYRTTLHTHRATGTGRQIEKHMRALLAVAGHGLADQLLDDRRDVTSP